MEATKPPGRVVELVVHLSGASTSNARQAVIDVRSELDLNDPISLVAAALVHLRGPVNAS